MLADPLADLVGPLPVVVLGFTLMLGGPLALLAWFIQLVANGHRGARDGVVFGLGVAAWASVSWLVVAYCGGYPCLPGLIVSEGLGVHPDRRWLQELVIHGVNFTLWPGFGWLIFRVREALRRGS